MAISERGYPINEYLDGGEIKRLCDYIADKESTSTPDGPINTTIGGPKEPGVIKKGYQNYGVINTSFKYVGKYQMGYAALAETKFVKFIKYPGYNNRMLWDPSNWLGKMGCTDIDSFLKNPAAQEAAMKEMLEINFRYMRKQISDCDKCDISGHLSAAHLVGWSGSVALRRNVNKVDGYGTDAASYFHRGQCAFLGLPVTAETPNKQRDPGKQDPIKTAEKAADYGEHKAQDTLNKPKAGSAPKQVVNPRDDDIKVPGDVVNKYANLGFRDPNFVYPKSKYIGHPDTNKLAYRKDISRTIVERKEMTRHGIIPTADGYEWEEPLSPYNAKYPYNKVMESESGHVIEIDDTPGEERLHNYHRTGTYDEVNSDGSKVQRIVGDSYEIIDRNGNIFINGKANITVGGACNLLILANCNIDVKGDTNITSENDVNWNVAGSMNLMVNETLNIRAGDYNLEVDNNRNEYTHGEYRQETHGNRYSRTRGTYTEQIKGDVKQLHEADHYRTVKKNTHIRTKENYYRNVEQAYHIQSTLDTNIDASNIWMNSGKSSAGTEVTGSASGKFTKKRWKERVELDTDKDLVTDKLVAVKTNLRFGQSRCKFSDTASPNLPYHHRVDEASMVISEHDQPLSDEPAHKISQDAPIITKKGIVKAEGVAYEKEKAGTVATNADKTNQTEKGSSKVTPDGVNIDSEQFKTMTSFPNSLRISKHFTVGDMLKGGNTLKAQTAGENGNKQNWTVPQIVFNMSNLAINILDPLKERYGNAFIGSGFRIGSSSMHGCGLAADMRFKGATLAQFNEIANWVKENLPYHQILIEASQPTHSCWIHISYNFGKKGGLPCATCSNQGVQGSPTTWHAKGELDIRKIPFLDMSFNAIAPGNNA